MQLLTDLTAAQRDAVSHGEGPLLVLAGPGSGKTRVITRRIAHLLHQGVRPWQVLAITFTNKAANEMRERVEQLVPGSRMWISTFHRFCARMLRQYAEAVGIEPNYTIYDTSDRRAAIRAVLKELELDATHYSPERIEAAISNAKNDLMGPEDFQKRAADHFRRVVAKVYTRYQQRLLEANAVDFDDLLLHVAELLKENPEIRSELDDRFRFVLVDEYQDTNLAQYAIARALSIDYPNLCATGDPDQSIYGWRGANLNNILEFERDFPATKVVRLEQNYRSTKSILRVADHLIRFNQRRKHKELFTENADGTPVRLVCYANELEEAAGIVERIQGEVAAGRHRWSDFAIFYRVNALSRTLELALRRANVPYQVLSGFEFYQRKEIKDVLAYLRLLNNPRDDVSFLRVVNVPLRGLGKTTLARLAGAARRQGLALFEAARHADRVEGLKPRQSAALMRFAETIERLAHERLSSVAALLLGVLDHTGYRSMLATSDNPQDEERLANVDELVSAARQYDEAALEEGSLEGFLEEVSLVSDTDEWEADAPKVTLMTLHAAKGLEFPAVFIIAVEQNILPHERSVDSPAQFEEERRLLFVGITRAQQELQLSHAQYRQYRGMTLMAIPSSFLEELPAEGIEKAYHEDVFGGTGDDAMEFPFGAGANGPTAAHERHSAFDEPGRDGTDRRPRKPATGPRRARLTTAAALAGEQPQAPPPADAFKTGMLVTHPEYGLGRIVAVSGLADNRKATVAFHSAGQRKFVLARSPLQPVKRK